MNDLASAIRNVAPTSDALTRYRDACFRRMLSNPWRVKAACMGTDTADWSGEIHWPPEDGGEDFDDLERLAQERLDRGDLTKMEVAELEAALGALDDFRQQRRGS